MKVINFGSLNYDYVYQVPHMVREGETLASTERKMFLGGKGLNQSIALARAGVKVFLAGLIGKDGKSFLEACRKNGISTKFIRETEENSGHTIIQVDDRAQNSILLYGGANQKITKQFIDFVLKEFEEGDILVLQNEINLLGQIIEKAYEKKMNIILNPSPYNQNLQSCDLRKISIFMINEVEGYQISGEKDPKKILKYMKEEYPDASVVLTLGEKGVIYQDKENLYKQDSFKVDAVDTTAAGDTFTGYFIAGLVEGIPIQQNLKRCAKAASIAVSRIGAAESIPKIEEVLL